MKKILLILVAVICMACDSEDAWRSLSNPFKNNATLTGAQPNTLDVCEYKGGQLHISGRCGKDGEILLILPTTKGDDRIIGSPRCSNGKYELITATFGRPPCEVVVEYGGSHELKANVNGAGSHCP